jgi:rRNA-processing protein FCF1
MLKEHRDIREEVRDAVHGPIDLVCLDLVIYELARLARKGSSETSRTARVVLGNLGKWKIREIPAPFGPRDVDLAMTIYALVQKTRTVVATADKILLVMLSSNRLQSVRPRSKSGLISSWTH